MVLQPLVEFDSIPKVIEVVHIATRKKRNKNVFKGVSFLQVLPFDDNVCLREPCQNYMKCISVLRFNSSAPFITSPSMLFRPIHPIAGLRCRCPTGFTGDYCEIEINMCYSNPCLNGGVCTRREGGYTCMCRENFTGKCVCSVYADAVCMLVSSRLT